MSARYIRYPVERWAREAEVSLRRSQERRQNPRRPSLGQRIFTAFGLTLAVLMIAGAVYIIFVAA